MYCKNCGAEMVGSFCASCGTQNEAQQETSQMQDNNRQSAYPQYEKFGGWLIVFSILIMLGVVVNLRNGLGTINISRDAMGYLDLLPDAFRTAVQIDLVAAIVVLITVVFQIVFLVNLFRRNANFLKFLQLAIICAFIATVLGLISANMVREFLEQEIFAQLIGTLVGNVIGLILYTMYYSRSVRVRTYMGSDEFLEKALFTMTK